ncbi:MAG: hypothetical protein ACRYHA_21740 [Janthinobacterium lividum]
MTLPSSLSTASGLPAASIASATVQTSERPQRPASRVALLVVGTFLLSFLIISLRNLEPLTYPVIFAEDGTWVGELFVHNFAVVAFRGKDFPTFGTVLLQQFSIWLFHVLPGGVLRLPLAIYLVSNAFTASIASIAMLSSRRFLSPLTRFGMWAAVVLMPVGIDGNEIFGRILNLGFLFPALQTLLLGRVFANRQSTPTMMVALLACLACGWTFPVSTGITGIAALLLIHRTGQRRFPVIPWQTWALLAVVALSILPLRAVSFSQGGAAMPYVPAGMTEFAFARVVLFPFVALVYPHLKDPIVLTIAIVLAILLGMSCVGFSRTTHDRRRFAIFFIASFLVYALATIVMRKGLTSLLNGQYANTFPDRYFYGVNVLAVFALLVTVAIVPTSARVKVWVPSLWLILSFVQPLLLKNVFELSHPTMTWRSHGTWQRELCAAAHDRGTVAIDWNVPVNKIATYPWGGPDVWAMYFPTKILEALRTSKACD